MAKKKTEPVDPLAQLRDLGYIVNQAMTIGTLTVLYVEGFGCSTYVRDDDPEAITALLDADAHAERVAQHEAGSVTS
jgi:hypothetical protein